MKRHIHYYLISLVFFLVIFGAIFLSSLSSVTSLNYFGNTNHYLFRQLIRIAIGLALAAIVFKLPLNFLKKISPFLVGFNLLLLGVVFFFGNNFFGATRWLSVGDITFQPSEFLKITSILYISALISNRFSEYPKKDWLHSAKNEYGNFIRVFLPFIILFSLIIVILYHQKDLGTLGIIAASLIVIYFSAGTPMWHIALSGLLALLSAGFFIWREPYRVQRIKIFLHLEADPLGTGLQIQQNLISMGSGGFFGKGLGMSSQKFGILPQAMSDSVFAVLGEELGFLGSSVLVGCFVLFFVFGLQVAQKTDDKFAKLSAIGISFWITVQAFMVFAATIGLMPLTGIPLPFFSYGGSHIITELVGIGILLNISKNG